MNSIVILLLIAAQPVITAWGAPPNEKNSGQYLEVSLNKGQSLPPGGETDLREREKALQYGLKHSPQLKVWKTRLARASAILKGARIFPNNPELGVEGGVRIPPAGDNASPSPQGGVELSLAFPIGGRWGRKIRWAKAQLLRIKSEWNAALFRYKLRFHQTWNSASAAALLWHKQREVTEFFLRLEKLTEKRFKHGAATKLDLKLIRASRQQSQLATAQSSLRLQQINTELKILAGLPPEQKKLPWKIGPLPALPPPPDLNQLFQKQREAHPTLMAAKAAIEQARAALSLAHSEAVPDLTLALRYSYEEREHVVMGALSIPLPLFWRNQGEIGAKKAELQRAKLLYSQLQYRLREQLKRDFSAYKTSLQMVKILKQRIQTVRQLAEMSEKGLAQGTFSIFQVVTAHQRILQNRLLYVQTLAEAHKNYLQLCRTAGILPEYK